MIERMIRRVVKPSTRAFWAEARRQPGFSLYDTLHGYIYARWPYLYIGIGVGEHPATGVIASFWRIFNGLKRILPNGNGSSTQSVMRLEPKGTGTVHLDKVTFADTYHGKVVPLSAARELVSIKEPIRIDDLEQVIPYKLARAIVLENPDHLVALECPCRAARPEPCLPLDVCLLIGEPFAGMVHEQHPERSRWIDSTEAVAILEAEESRGHVHHAFFKDAMLGRFYAICNCCACCCGALQAQRNGTPMLASSGYLPQVDEILCHGCGVCEALCQFAAISVPDGIAVVEDAVCMGCGICVGHCQNAALSLVRAPSKGEPLEICALMAALPIG